MDAFLHAAMLMTTPILLAAIGGLVNRIGGLVNIGLESMMLAGALAAVVALVRHRRSGLLARRRAPVGAALGLVMSWSSRVSKPTRSSSASASTSPSPASSILAEERPRRVGNLQSAGCGHVAALCPSGRRLDPRAGRRPFRPGRLTWFAWAMVPVTAFMLQDPAGPAFARHRRRRDDGARRRPFAAGVRDASTAFAGAMAGLAGAHLSIGVVGLFNEGLTGGRGFVALAAFYFGRACRRARRSARCCSVSSMRRRSVCKAAAFPPSWCRRCPI